MRLHQSPGIHACLSRYRLNHCRPLSHVSVAFRRSCSYVGVAHKLLYCRAIEDPEVFVRFGLEGRSVTYSDDELIEGRDFVPYLAWYGS